MEIQFDRIPVPYLQLLTGQVRTQEQTLEVRLPDGMPDIGRVLGAWGQVVVRSKEWNGTAMGVSCGVMAWVLYVPEDGEGVQSVEAWLPFAMKWELPDSQYDGKIIACCQLKSVDARSTSARKLMVRANLEVTGQAWQQDTAQCLKPEGVPADVSVLTAEYPVLLAKEAGEKPFLLEEEMCLPAGNPKIGKLMYYSLEPEIIDKKIMAGKLVFRGSAVLHILYRGEDQKLYTWDCDLPFSQYGDLDVDFREDAIAWVYPCVTSLDVNLDENGGLRLNAGLLGQYLLAEYTPISVAEDAYSIRRAVSLTLDSLQLPAILDANTQNISMEKTVQADARQIVDVTFNPRQGAVEMTEKGAAMALGCPFQVLYYDDDGKLSSTAGFWEGNWELPAAADCTVVASVRPLGRAQATIGPGDISLRGDVCVEARVNAGQGIPMVTHMELGESVKPDPNRPGLILRRAGKNRLWDIAKETGTTVDAIKKANRLQEEPPADKVLLIPVP